MKFLLALSLLTSVAFAQEAANVEVKKEETAVVVEKKDDKKAAYKAAKEACLNENKDLKGKSLKECIVSKTK